MTTDALLADPAAPDRWERALYAFLAEKERRSGSVRTVQSYSRMLRYFFGRLSKTPDEVQPSDVLAYAHGVGLSGREPSAITIGARIACVSSFFRFCIRMRLLDANPCDALERPRTPPSTPRGLTAEEVRRLLAIIPDTPVGLRDRAIVLFLVLTGRRRAEVLRLTVGDIEPGAPAYYVYRGKGGKTGRRELPQPAYVAFVAALTAFGQDLGACAQTSRSGPRRPTRAACRAARCTPTSGATSAPQSYPRPGSTSCATPPPSCGGKRASRWRTCRGSWTTRRWP